MTTTFDPDTVIYRSAYTTDHGPTTYVEHVDGSVSYTDERGTDRVYDNPTGGEPIIVHTNP